MRPNRFFDRRDYRRALAAGRPRRWRRILIAVLVAAALSIAAFA